MSHYDDNYIAKTIAEFKRNMLTYDGERVIYLSLIHI